MAQDLLTLYKLIILYMLNKVNFKLTYSQISSFILEREYTNFLTLQQVITELQETELIKAETLTNRTYFSITDEGRNTLSYFGSRIGEAIVNDIDTFLSENRMELKNESSITANYYKATSGQYEAALTLQEKNVDLLSIKISVPARDIAQNICDNWYKKNEAIYKYLMEELL